MLKQNREYFRNYNCYTYENTIKIRNLKHPRLIPEIINTLKRQVLKFNHKNIKLDFFEFSNAFTYPTLPISGYLQYFKNIHKVTFELLNPPKNLSAKDFLNPSIVNEETEKKVNKYLFKIWEFRNTNDIKIILNGIMDNIRKNIECESGVLYSCEWGINEIMDNVLIHSKQDRGYILVNLVKDINELQVCIFDYGIGIYNSMKQSNFKPVTPADAISLAIQKGVKGGESDGQGNGMWGLFKMITENQGTLIINSGLGGLRYINQSKKVQNAIDLIILDKTYQTTTVYFSFKLNKSIDFRKALETKNYVDLYVESYEDDKNNLIFKVAEENSGTGTRPSGNQMRNKVINLNKQSKKPVSIDFSGVTLITSSFADEFIAKLLVNVGLIQFQNNIKIVNLDKINESILNKAIAERFHQEFLEQNGNIISFDKKMLN